MLKPRNSYDIEVNLAKYTYDPMVITGWRIPKPGRYELQLSYDFDMRSIKKKFGKGCKDIVPRRHLRRHTATDRREVDSVCEAADPKIHRSSQEAPQTKLGRAWQP